MADLEDRSKHELQHSKYLADNDPEALWNWKSPAGQKRARRRGRLLTEAAQLAPGMKVMEVGCGTGLFTEMMAESGAHILAVDLSPDLLDIARRRGLPASQVEFREMRFEDGESDGPFDAIVGSSILHHLEMEPALKKIFTLLKPGGVITFAEPNMLNPQIWAERNIPFIRKMNNQSPDETAIHRWQFARLLARLGYVNISIRNTDWLHPAIPALLVEAVYAFGLLLEHLPLVREFSGSVLIYAERPRS